MATYTQQCSKVGSFSYANNFILYVVLTERDVSIENNTSYVEYNVYCQSSGSGSISARHLKYFSINGEEKINITETVNASSPNAYIGIASGSIGPIAHNNDGSKKISFSAQIQGATFGVSASISGEMELTTINRKSNVSLSSANVTLGNAVTIYTNRSSSNFTHSLYWQNNSGSWQTIATGVGDSYAWTPPVSMASDFTSGTSGVRNIICETYNGSTYIGSSTAQLTFNVPSSVVPSISNLAISNPQGHSVYVETLSTVKVQTTASGSYESTISSCVVTMSIDGSVRKTLYGTDVTFDLYNLNIGYNDKTVTITSTITDSRGRTATSSKNITVYFYYKPFISATNTFRCNSSGVADNNGTYISVYWGYAVRTIGGNTENANVRYRQVGSSSWTSVSLGNAATAIIGGGAISTDSRYEVEYSIGDSFYSGITKTDQVNTAYVTADFKAGGKGIAIGKVAEEDIFDVDMDSKFRKDARFYGDYVDFYSQVNFEQVPANNLMWNYIYIWSGNNLNNYTISGSYFIASNVTNSPSDWCTLFIIGDGNICTQIATSVLAERTWIRNNVNGSWNVWEEIIKNKKYFTSDDLNNVKEACTLYADRACANIPMAGYSCYVTVIPCQSTDNYVLQEAVIVDGAPQNMYTFRRQCYGGVWTGWTVANGSNVLYNNSYGTNGTVTLSDSAANYEYLEIFYRDNDNNYRNVKIYSPNGKYAALTSTTMSNGTVYKKEQRIHIFDSSIEQYNWCEWYFSSGGTPSIIWDANNIYIHKVVGYKY